MLAAGGERPEIENGQRGIRVAEKAEGKRWEPRFFGRVEDDGMVGRLGMKNGLGGEKMARGLEVGWREGEDGVEAVS